MPGDEPTTYLVRHAKAGSRERWTAPDRDRPLTDAGRIQAAGFVKVIGRGVRSIKSSPYKRCVETVLPLAEALGLLVEEEDRLAEGAGPDWALTELATAGGTVLCTHGDVMAEVVISLADAKVPLQGGMQWAKGATWAFDIAAGRILAGRYLAPPI
jgi:phosphohistidine phosphatase SixA